MNNLLRNNQLMTFMGVYKISTTLLWELTLVFAAIAVLFLFLIFMLRSRISGRRYKVEVQKRELASMVSHFLFFPQDSNTEYQEEDLRRRQEFRKLLDTPLNREALSEILHELSQDVSGMARERLLTLYQDLGLQEEAYRKLQSSKWETISRGILELSDMQVEQAYFIIRKFIYDNRSILRKQAELAIISLTDMGIQSFLDAARGPISEWQQLRIMEILKRKDSFLPPDFKHWLTSENEDVILLSLRLIRYFKQSEAAAQITGLLTHSSTEIQLASLECIRDLAYEPAKDILKQNFADAVPQIKLGILDALRPIIAYTDKDWLQNQAAGDEAFAVRNKSNALLQALEHTATPAPVNPTLWDQEQVVEETRSEPDSNGKIPIPSDSTNTSAQEMAYDLMLDLLKPDFSALRVDWEMDNLSVLQQDFIAPTPENLPEESWRLEETLVFDACVMEVLEDICSDTPESVDFHQNIPEFLPLIDQSLTPTNMNPYEPSPEWLLRIEVQAEILLSDSGHAKMLREILLEDLEETEHVLNTNFVAWVTEADSHALADDTNSETTEELLRQFPEFEVIADDIHELQDHNQSQYIMKEPTLNTEDQKELPDYFSIFHEFFRSYDAESKLILMEEIPEIGGEKELRFLAELFHDPNPRIRAKARKTHKILRKKLGLSADDLKGPSGSLWTPQDPTTQKASTEVNTSTEPTEDQTDEKFEELDFELEYEGMENSQSQEAVTQKPKRHNSYLRLLKYLNGSQNDTHV